MEYKKQIKMDNVDENCQIDEEYSNNSDFERYQTGIKIHFYCVWADNGRVQKYFF